MTSSFLKRGREVQNFAQKLHYELWRRDILEWIMFLDSKVFSGVRKMGTVTHPKIEFKLIKMK